MFFNFLNWLRSFRKPRRGHPTIRRRPPSFQPEIERLETRQLLAAIAGFTQYTIPSGSSSPTGMIVGPDNNTWFTEQSIAKIGKVTTGSTFTEYAVPNNLFPHHPYGITAGPDGLLWYTDWGGQNGGYVSKVTTSGTFTQYATTTASSSPHGITAGPDGRLWFTESALNKIGAVTTS